MIQRPPFDNRYCSGCQCTTRHEIKEEIFSCLRCGAIKYPSKSRETFRLRSEMPLMLMKVNCA
jgi:hypothetical protein